MALFEIFTRCAKYLELRRLFLFALRGKVKREKIKKKKPNKSHKPLTM